MLTDPSMLVEAAKRAGMKFPEDCDNYDKEEYPRRIRFIQ